MTERNENIFTNLPKAFKGELEAVVQQVLIRNGIKKDAEIIQSVEFTDNSRDSLLLYVNDYYQSLSKGRKPKAKKIPIYTLIKFLKKNRINHPKRSVTQIAFAMQTSIYKNGIKGKHFIEQIENSVMDVVELRVADFLEEFLADSIYASFQVG